jgi:acyl-CoA synthetase (AMP-forming)/AMP-acid ligase II
MPAQTFHSLLTELSPSARSNAPAITIPSSGSSPAIHLDYSNLESYVEAFATALKGSQVQGGQVVSLSLINSLEFVGAFLATGWLRAVSAPLNPAYTQDEIEFYLSDTKSSILIVKDGESSEDRPTLKAAKKCGVKVVSVKLSKGQDGKIKVDLKTIYEPSAGSTVAVSLLLNDFSRAQVQLFLTDEAEQWRHSQC